MNWVGGARNRLRGTLHNDRKVQKEFFERQRLRSHTSATANRDNTARPTNTKTTDHRKKHRISQDVLSIKRQQKTNAVNNSVNATGTKRVENIELPVSPIETPSALQLSLSPASQHDSTGKEQRGLGYQICEDMHHKKSNVYRDSKGMPSGPAARIDLFGVRTERPVKLKVNQNCRPKDGGTSSFAVHGSRVLRESRQPLHALGDLPTFDSNKISDRIPKPLWKTMDCHSRNILVSEDFQAVPSYKNGSCNLIEDTDLAIPRQCIGHHESVETFRDPARDSSYNFRYEGLSIIPELNCDKYNSFLAKSSMSDAHGHQSSEAFESTPSNADSFEVSVVNSPPPGGSSYLPMNADDHREQSIYSGHRNVDPAFHENTFSYCRMERRDSGMLRDPNERLCHPNDVQGTNHPCSQNSRVDQIYGSERRDMTVQQCPELRLTDGGLRQNRQYSTNNQHQLRWESENSMVYNGQADCVVSQSKRNCKELFLKKSCGEPAAVENRESTNAFIVSAGLDFTPDWRENHLAEERRIRGERAASKTCNSWLPRATSSSSIVSITAEGHTTRINSQGVRRNSYPSVMKTKGTPVAAHVFSPFPGDVCPSDSVNAVPGLPQTTGKTKLQEHRENSTIPKAAKSTVPVTSTRPCEPWAQSKGHQHWIERAPSARGRLRFKENLHAQSEGALMTESPGVDDVSPSVYEVVTYLLDCAEGGGRQHPHTIASSDRQQNRICEAHFRSENSHTPRAKVTYTNGSSVDNNSYNTDNHVLGRSPANPATSPNRIIHDQPSSSGLSDDMDKGGSVTCGDRALALPADQGNESRSTRSTAFNECDNRNTVDNLYHGKKCQSVWASPLILQAGDASKVSIGTQTTPKLPLQNTACSPIWAVSIVDRTLPVSTTDTATINGKVYSLRSRCK